MSQSSNQGYVCIVCKERCNDNPLYKPKCKKCLEASLPDTTDLKSYIARKLSI